LTVWSDGSRLESGRVGAGLAWQTQQGSWQTREIPMGVGYETSRRSMRSLWGPAEPWSWLKTTGVKGQGPVKAAIKRRLQLRKPSPGQSSAIRAYRAGE